MGDDSVYGEETASRANKSLWYKKYQEDPEWSKLLKSIFKRKYDFWFEDPENAMNEAIFQTMFEKLPDLTPKNNKNLDAFVTTVFATVVIDLRRKEKGRIRPPQIVKAAGTVVMDIFDLHCVKRRDIEKISKELGLEIIFVRHRVGWIDAHNLCGYRPVPKTLTSANPEDSGHQIDLKDDQRDPAADVMHRELQSFLGYLINGASCDKEKLNQLPVGLRAVLSASLALSDIERNLLKLSFAEGLKSPAIAAQFGWSTRQVNDTKKALLSRISFVLRDNDIDFS